MSIPYTEAVGPERLVTCCCDEPVTLALAQFFSDNADGIEADEHAEIITTLAAGARYLGGGGAAAKWFVELAR